MVVLFLVFARNGFEEFVRDRTGDGASCSRHQRVLPTAPSPAAKQGRRRRSFF